MCHARAWALCPPLAVPGSTSDKGYFVTPGVGASAPDRQDAHLPQYAAPRVRCTAFVRGRGEHDIRAFSDGSSGKEN